MQIISSRPKPGFRSLIFNISAKKNGMAQLGQHLQVAGTGTITATWFENEKYLPKQVKIRNTYRHI